MTSDQRIALSVFAVAAVVGGGIFLLVSISGGDNGPQAHAEPDARATAPPVEEEAAAQPEPPPACSGEIRGVPIREGQHPDAWACEAMEFAVRFFQAPVEQCADFVSSELVPECESRGALPKWSYVSDHGVDPSFPDIVCVGFAFEAEGETRDITVKVERINDAQRIVGDGC